MTWTENIADQIENATQHFVTVTAFNGTLPNPPTTSSANIQIGFVAVPSQPGTDFVTVLDSIPRLGDWIGPDNPISPKPPDR